MPELPEVETTRRGIRPHLLHQKIGTIIVRQRQLRWPVPRALNALTDHWIESVERRGKYILLSSPPGTAIIHLGMSGSLRIVQGNEPARKHDHVEFQLPGNRCLRFHDPRRFGCVLWTRKNPLAHPLLAGLGPEPLSEEFSGDYLFQCTRKRKTAIKALIMNSQIVVGVGNIYASEALFLAGIRPGIASGRVSGARCAYLAGCIRQVLTEAIEAGGTTLRDFVNPRGEPGYFSQSLRVYDRFGQPCQRCNGTIKRKIIGQRASYYCPRCQR